MFKSSFFFLVPFLLLEIQHAESFHKTVAHGYECGRANGYEPIKAQAMELRGYYMECENNIAYQVKCPDHLQFDASKQYPYFPCNYPSRITQDDHEVIESPAPSHNEVQLQDYDYETDFATNNNNDYVCSQRDGYEAVPNNCNQYIKCQDFVPHQAECYDGLYFDDSKQYPHLPCNYPSQVKCSSSSASAISTQRESTQHYNVIPTSLEHSFEKYPLEDHVCKQSHGYETFADNCNYFVECQNNEAYKTKCTNGLNFDPSVRYPSNPCTSVKNHCDAAPAAPTGDCPNQRASMLSPLAAPNDFGHYRVCVGGKPFEMYCPTGFSYNPGTEVCEWSSEVSERNTEDSVEFKCPAASYNFGVAKITNHRKENECNNYYSCLNGEARVASCDPGLAFNHVTARCEDATVVQCNQRTA